MATLLLPLVLGCAVPPSVPAALPAPVGTRAPPPEQAAAPIPLNEVEAPQSLLLVARLEPNLAADLAIDGELRSFVPFWLAERGRTIDDEDVVVEFVSREAPVELALAVESPESLIGRGPEVVVSIPVTSRSAALNALRQLESRGDVALGQARRGVVAVRAVEESERRVCWLSAALGPANARLICGSESALELLAPYMARGLAVRDLGKGELIVEAWPRKLGLAHGRKLASLARFVTRGAAASGDAKQRFAGRALADLLEDASDLLSDVERVRFVAERRGEGLELGVTAELVGRGSWLARTLSSLPGRGDGARELFWKLPRDTELAWFFAGPEPARSREARQALVQWLAAMVGPGYERRTLELVARTFVPAAPYVYAQGDIHGADAITSAGGGHAIWQRTLSSYGWHVMGYDEPSTEYEPVLDAGMQAYNDRDLGRLAYASLPRLCPGLGKIRKLGRPKELPVGSALFELPLPGKFFDDCARRGYRASGRAAPNESIVVVMVPDGKRTWIGFGPKRQEMVKRVASLAKASVEQTLAVEPTLQLLREPGAQAGGFTSLAGHAGLLRFLSMSEPWRWRRDRLSRLPNQGRSRIPFTFSVVDAGPLRIEAKLSLSAQAFGELRRAGVAH